MTEIIIAVCGGVLGTIIVLGSSWIYDNLKRK